MKVVAALLYHLLDAVTTPAIKHFYRPNMSEPSNKKIGASATVICNEVNDFSSTQNCATMI